jgi:hypothetical protein
MALHIKQPLQWHCVMAGALYSGAQHSMDIMALFWRQHHQHNA